MNDKPVIQKIVLGGVVVKNAKILLLQRQKNENVYPGMWELPSGKREILEPSEFTLVREIKEETGLDVTIVAPVSVFDYQIEKLDEVRDSTQINFLLKPLGDGVVKLSSEHQAFSWIKKGEADEYQLSKETRATVNKSFDFIDRYQFNF